MLVVLKKQVHKLGNPGDVCTVSNGYARNFLLPKGLAVQATPDALRAGEEQKKRKEKTAKRELKETAHVATRVDGYELTLNGKANDTGTLFASISKKKIAEALTENGFTVSASHVQLAAPIKELGEHKVTLAFPHGLEAQVRVIVEAI